MLVFFCLFVPSLMGILIIDKLNNEETKFRKLFNIYFSNLFFVNVFIFIAMIFIYGFDFNFAEAINSKVGFTLNFFLLASCMSFLFSLITKAVSENLKLKMVVKKNAKKK